MTNWSYDAQRRTGKLTVATELTVAGVSELSEALLRGFEASDRVVLDLGAVSDIDIAGLQLLCAAHRFAVARGKELLLAEVGVRPRELARAAGFVRGDLCSIGRDVPCFWIKVA